MRKTEKIKCQNTNIHTKTKNENEKRNASTAALKNKHFPKYPLAA